MAGVLVTGVDRVAAVAGAGTTVYNFEVEGTHTYFVGKTDGGEWVHNGCYRATFFAAHPELNPSEWVVHHAIEQQVLNRYPGLFTESEINDLSNLRGISNDTNSWAHLSAIRQQWNGFYNSVPNPTKGQIVDFAAKIDNAWGDNFIW